MLFSSCCTDEWKPHFEFKKPFCVPSKDATEQVDVIDNPNLRMKAEDVTVGNLNLFETMKCEKNRWDSFHNKWPLEFISINELVESGFFYLQSDDKVQCAYCYVILHSWSEGDKPLKEHIKSSPKCPRLINSGKTNFYNYFPSNSVLTAISSHSSTKPVNSQMIDVQKRLLTFKRWPRSAISVRELADCGLYYTGAKDIVTCFYCGGSLSNWESTDVPIVEHSKYYPQCGFLKVIKIHPGYKRLKSSESSFQNGMNSVPQELSTNRTFDTDVVQKAKEIFTPSLVDEVLAYTLQRGQTFSSLHQLCEKVLEYEHKVDKSRSSLEMKASSKPNTVMQSKSPCSESKKTPSNLLLCLICMEREREVTFQPCAHLISCERCAGRLTTCPICRQVIEGRVRTFLS